MLSIMKKYTFLYLILSVIIVSCNQEQKNHEKENQVEAIKKIVKIDSNQSNQNNSINNTKMENGLYAKMNTSKGTECTSIR